ncbi:MAG: diacylglycerol kinase family protein [Nanoarchaeota archaeon]
MKEGDIKIIEKVKSKSRFFHAFRGLYIFYKTTRNLKIHLSVAILVIFFGFYFSVSEYEWLALILSIIFVLCAEAFNTAFEIDIDLTSPEYHPYARDTKDVAAGAVLIASLGAVIVGLIIFVPKILMVY